MVRLKVSPIPATAVRTLPWDIHFLAGFTPVSTLKWGHPHLKSGNLFIVSLATDTHDLAFWQHSTHSLDYAVSPVTVATPSIPVKPTKEWKGYNIVVSPDLSGIPSDLPRKHELHRIQRCVNMIKLHVVVDTFRPRYSSTHMHRNAQIKLLSSVSDICTVIISTEVSKYSICKLMQHMKRSVCD